MAVAVEDVGEAGPAAPAVGATASVLLYPLFWPPLLLNVFTLLLLVVLISGNAARFGVAVGLDPRLGRSADWRERGPPDPETEVNVVDIVLVVATVPVTVVVLADMVGLCVILVAVMVVVELDNVMEEDIEEETDVVDPVLVAPIVPPTNAGAL